MMSWLHSWFSHVQQTRRGPTRRVLGIEQLDERVVPAGVIAVGAGPGGGGLVALFHDSNNDGIPDSTPYAVLPALDPGSTRAVRVAVGHFTSTSTLQLAVAAGPGGPPRV